MLKDDIFLRNVNGRDQFSWSLYHILYLYIYIYVTIFFCTYWSNHLKSAAYTVLYLLPQTEAGRELRKTLRKASLGTVGIGGPLISWLWEHNTVVHTIVVDSHTSLPSSSSLVMEKLSGCSHCGQAASVLPWLLYILQKTGKSKIKSIVSPAAGGHGEMEWQANFIVSRVTLDLASSLCPL